MTIWNFINNWIIDWFQLYEEPRKWNCRFNHDIGMGRMRHDGVGSYTIVENPTLRNRRARKPLRRLRKRNFAIKWRSVDLKRSQFCGHDQQWMIAATLALDRMWISLNSGPNFILCVILHHSIWLFRLTGGSYRYWFHRTVIQFDTNEGPFLNHRGFSC